MALVEDFLKRHFTNHNCDSCGRHFPLSCLVTFDSPFPEIAGKYCVCCSHKVFDLVDYCDSCGEEYPKGHLFKSLISEEKYCKTCLRNEMEEYE